MQKYKFKHYETLILLPIEYKVAIAKSILVEYPSLQEILMTNYLPTIRFVAHKDFVNPNSLNIVKNKPLVFDIYYKDEKYAFGIRKLYKIWPKLKEVMPKLQLNAILQDNVAYLTALASITIKQQDLPKFFSSLEKAINQLLIPENLVETTNTECA